MKKILLTFLLSVVFLFTEAQIKVVFFTDVPPLHAERILMMLVDSIPKYLPDTVEVFQAFPVPNAYCSITKAYNVNVFIKALDTCSRKTIAITYRPLILGCSKNFLDGYSDFKNGIVTLYNVGSFNRLLKLCLHELGHTYGLEHCNMKGCFMEAGGIEDQNEAIDREYHFCFWCHMKILNHVQNKNQK